MIGKVAWACGMVLVMAGCASSTSPRTSSAAVGSFGQDAAFVKEHTPVVELTDANGARVLVAPALQGRVLTSTAGGEAGPAYGWINKELFASGKLGPHINAFGGEDRFWIGPEGGQFSIFFAPGAPFDMEHWQTPAPIDTEAFDVVSKDRGQVTLRRQFTLTNYSKTKFDVRIDRQVRLLAPAQAWKQLHLEPGQDVKLVAFESMNRLTNVGKEPWTQSTGLLSIWILGMFNASPDAVVLVPYKQGPESELGPVVESGYFGSVPPDRLQAKEGIIYFRADAHFRSKIGVSPARAMGVLGSYDAGKKVLTLVQYSLPAGHADYVNSQWKLQDQPFTGDVANSYNDGPNALGTNLGNFYELESSSPAAALAPGQTAEHVQRTIHLTGDKAELDRVSQAVLGVHLDDIPRRLPARSNP